MNRKTSNTTFINENDVIAAYKNVLSYLQQTHGIQAKSLSQDDILNKERRKYMQDQLFSAIRQMFVQEKFEKN